MLTKLFGALMLKLTRLIVAIKNAFRKKEPINKSEIPTSSKDTKAVVAAIKAARRKAIKETCQECDYCEECGFYDYEKGCVFAESDEGIPCYWEVDE